MTASTIAPPLPISAAASTPDAFVASASASASVVIVDDDAVSRAVLRTMLQRCGWDVTIVSNGRDVVAWAEAGNTADLVLMDCHMPGMNGFDATRRLRANGYTGTIVAVTADIFDENNVACLRCGMDDVMLKPITLQQLDARMRIAKPTR